MAISFWFHLAKRMRFTLIHIAQVHSSALDFNKYYLGVMSNEITTPKPKRWKSTHPLSINHEHYSIIYIYIYYFLLN